MSPGKAAQQHVCTKVAMYCVSLPYRDIVVLHIIQRGQSGYVPTALKPVGAIVFKIYDLFY